MTTVEQLYHFINSLENPKVKFGDHPLYDSIDLRTLTSDLIRFDNLEDWLKSKNMPIYLKENVIKAVIKAILSTNPPEEVRNELVCLML
jgi:hypothetical protein